MSASPHRYLATTLMLMLMLLQTSGCHILRRADHPQAEANGRWDRSDARRAARQLTGELLDGEWISRHREEHRARPVLIVGNIRNETGEAIDTGAITNRLMDALRRSGDLSLERFDTSGEENRSGTSYSLLRRAGERSGADYMLIGNINALARKTDRPGQALVSYRLNLELVHIETNRKAFIGSWGIRKAVEI